MLMSTIASKKIDPLVDLNLRSDDVVNFFFLLLRCMTVMCTFEASCLDIQSPNLSRKK